VRQGILPYAAIRLFDVVIAEPLEAPPAPQRLVVPGIMAMPLKNGVS
jgi:hypothetical protein